MRVIEPQQFGNFKRQQRNPTKRFINIFLVVLLACSLGYGVWAAFKPLPAITGELNLPTTQAQTIKLNWPTKGQAAVGAEGYGTLATTDVQKSAPIASIAKVMVALSVLKEHPLKPGEQGPLITLDGGDVAAYKKELAREGSNVKVKVGEKISEYDALEALLLPSANNMATTLARWSFGSEEKYLIYANNLAKQLDMDSSHFADASGFSPKTVSTAEDVVLLGQAAMQDQVFAQIVAKPRAQIPVAGTITNVNTLVGKNGIVGIKTGNTEQAGGCFLFAAKHNFGQGQSVVVIGAILGQSNLDAALARTQPLLDSTYKGFGERLLIAQNDVVGHYNVPWTEPVDVSAQNNLKTFGWLGSEPELKGTLGQLHAPQAAGAVVGDIKSGNQSTNIVLNGAVAQPSYWWRLKHAL